MVDFPLLLFVASFVTLTLVVWCGDFLRKRSKNSAEANRDDSGVVLGGTLTLLGLLIGFSFAMAISRYDLRKNGEQTEANVIAALYMRADLLAPDEAAKVHELLHMYTNQRIAFYTTRDLAQLRQIDIDTLQTQNQLWPTIKTDLGSLPPPLQGLFVTGTNDVVVARLSTQAVWSNRIPTAAWVLIAATAIGCNFLIGYRARRTDWFVFLIMPFVVTVSLLLIADLDSPRSGAIRVRPNNLISLAQSIGSNQLQ